MITSLALADGTRSSSEGKTIIARSMRGGFADERDWRLLSSGTFHFAGSRSDGFSDRSFIRRSRSRTPVTIRDSLKKRNCCLESEDSNESPNEGDDRFCSGFFVGDA